MLLDAIVGHFVADYLAQNDWMAREKKRSSWVCAFHCFLWAGFVCTFVWGFSQAWNPWIMLWLFGSHFAIDRWGFVPWFMRVNGQEAFSQPPTGPWSVIMVDQVFHLLTLWLVFPTWEF